MASKKVQNALASTTTPDQILAVAGVEVKLTKSELAEYVKELAIRELDKQYDEAVKARDSAEGKIGWGGESIKISTSNIPARVKNISIVMQENDVRVSDIDLFIETDAPAVWRIAYVDEHERHIRIPHKEGDYPVPSKYIEYVALHKRVDDIRNKLYEIKNKNYKVLMIENALMSTDAGKMLVTNLQQMVKDLTAI